MPAAFLFSAPLSDALFLALTLASVYLMRKRQYPFASIVGFFAALTRAPGILIAVPLCFELVGNVVREYKENHKNHHWWIRQIKDVLFLLLIPCGFLLYLHLNFVVTGNALTFLTYQRAHWHQRPGWFFVTVNTQMDNLLENLSLGGNLRLAIGLWMPNLVYIITSLGLVTVAQTRMRASYIAYFIAYFLVCVGATWLLSAPRYLTACFPLALALGVLTEKREVDGLVTILCVGLMLAYLAAYVHQWYVY